MAPSPRRPDDDRVRSVSAVCEAGEVAVGTDVTAPLSQTAGASPAGAEAGIDTGAEATPDHRPERFVPFIAGAASGSSGHGCFG